MKIYQILKASVIGLCLAMQAHAQTGSLNAIDTLKTNPNWQLIQPGTSCIEQYQFKPNGEVSIQSLQERVTGTYQYIISPNNFQLPAMVIHFETDNQKPDCTGSSVNQAGTSTTNFLKKGADQKIYFCDDALGKNCSVYLRPEH